MATALFETGAGSGLSLGSSAAWRRAVRRQNNASSSLFDADFIAEMIAVKGRSQVSGVRCQVLGLRSDRAVFPETSEPRALAVFAIGVAKLCFEHCSLTARPDDLYWNQHEQNGQELRPFDDKDDPDQKDHSGNINRIADPRIDAAGDKRGRLRSNGERSAERVAGENHAREADQSDQQADQTHRTVGLGYGVEYPAENQQARDHRQPDAQYRPTVHRYQCI